MRRRHGQAGLDRGTIAHPVLVGRTSERQSCGMKAAARFWRFMDDVAASAGDASATALTSALRCALASVSMVDRRQFWLHYDEATWALHSYDVWGCAAIVCGGELSDDWFEYWRRWLVLQGGDLHRGMLVNPDAALADYWESVGLMRLPRDAVIDFCNGEHACSAFADCGVELRASRRVRARMDAGPAGTPWTSRSEWRQRFPALIRLFGGR